jgi:Hydrogenase maturation factor
MSHGAGGRAMAELISSIFKDAFGNELLEQGNDQASFPTPTGGRMVMTTDGYVVSPIFFPGGDIGSLAVHGTVNDLAMAGAKPLYLSASYIIEEGFPFGDLKRIADPWARQPGGRRDDRHRRHQGGGARQGGRRLHLDGWRRRVPDGPSCPEIGRDRATR